MLKLYILPFESLIVLKSNKKCSLWGNMQQQRSCLLVVTWASYLGVEGGKGCSGQNPGYFVSYLNKILKFSAYFLAALFATTVGWYRNGYSCALLSRLIKCSVGSSGFKYEWFKLHSVTAAQRSNSTHKQIYSIYFYWTQLAMAANKEVNYLKLVVNLQTPSSFHQNLKVWGTTKFRKEKDGIIHDKWLAFCSLGSWQLPKSRHCSFII